MTATPAPQPKFVEKRSIDYIPASERHGRPVSLFFVWFAANSSITALVTGALMTILGNSALWSIPAIILGNILGGYITALHSAQGPQLGVPQMIQSRAQFGFYGAILPLILALFIYIGFYATGLVLGGQALGLLFHVSPQIGAILFAIFCALSAIVGYRWIHKFSHLPAFLSAIVFVWLIVVMVTGDMGQAIGASNGFALAPFVLGVLAADLRALYRRLQSLPADDHLAERHGRMDILRQRPRRQPRNDRRLIRCLSRRRRVQRY